MVQTSARPIGRPLASSQPGNCPWLRPNPEIDANFAPGSVEKVNFSSRFSQSTLQRGGFDGLSCPIIPPPGGGLRVGRGSPPPFVSM
jgi:hypothetical protein